MLTRGAEKCTIIIIIIMIVIKLQDEASLINIHWIIQQNALGHFM